MSGRHAQEAPGSLMEAILHARTGKVSVYIGLSSDAVTAHFSGADFAIHERLPLMVRIGPEQAMETDDEVLALLARTALDNWPFWYGGEGFLTCENTSAGRELARIEIHHIRRGGPFHDLTTDWAERAVDLVLSGRPPSVAGIPAQIQLQQLCLAIHPGGLLMIVEISRLDSDDQARGLVRSLEWLAENGPLAVIALLPVGSTHYLPLQRILYGAYDGALVTADSEKAKPRTNTKSPVEFLGTVRGRPHHNSRAEQRLAVAIRKDPELSYLFAFNQSVETVRGSRYCVDLVWREGRVLVEVDGEQHYGDLEKYDADRQRDYELNLSGYLVLRLSSNAVLRDTPQCLDKIRDFVKYRRANW